MPSPSRWAGGISTPISFSLGQDTAVSRAHFAIIRRGDTFLLNNLSANGTSVNGLRTDQALLKSNDLLKIGLQTVIRFTLENRPEREANPNFG